jgi:hypothetical protein
MAIVMADIAAKQSPRSEELQRAKVGRWTCRREAQLSLAGRVQGKKTRSQLRTGMLHKRARKE